MTAMDSDLIDETLPTSLAVAMGLTPSHRSRSQGSPRRFSVGGMAAGIAGLLLIGAVLTVVVIGLIGRSPIPPLPPDPLGSDDETEIESVPPADLHDEIADKVYLYEGEGAGGSFTIRLDADGSAQYYEGYISSHIGIGTWTLEGSVVVMVESSSTRERTNRFDYRDGTLYFRLADSDGFIYLDIPNGAAFHAMHDLPAEETDTQAATEPDTEPESESDELAAIDPPLLLTGYNLTPVALKAYTIHDNTLSATVYTLRIVSLDCTPSEYNHAEEGLYMDIVDPATNTVLDSYLALGDVTLLWDGDCNLLLTGVQALSDPDDGAISHLRLTGVGLSIGAKDAYGNIGFASTGGHTFAIDVLTAAAANKEYTVFCSRLNDALYKATGNGTRTLSILFSTDARFLADAKLSVGDTVPTTEAVLDYWDNLTPADCISSYIPLVE